MAFYQDGTVVEIGDRVIGFHYGDEVIGVVVDFTEDGNNSVLVVAAFRKSPVKTRKTIIDGISWDSETRSYFIHNKKAAKAFSLEISYITELAYNFVKF